MKARLKISLTVVCFTCAAVAYMSNVSNSSATDQKIVIPTNRINKHTAVQLIADATYALNYCRPMRPNMEAMRAFFKQSGYDLDEMLDEPAYTATIQSEVSHLRRTNSRFGCIQLNNSFGPDGATYKGLFEIVYE